MAPRQSVTWRMSHLAELQQFGPHTANNNRAKEPIFVTIMKLTMPASQRSQFDMCHYIIICSIKSEMCDEAICSFIACLGLHAQNTNKVIELILWPMWSWHCQLHNGHKMGSVALLVFAVWGPKGCNSARWPFSRWYFVLPFVNALAHFL